MSTEINTRGMIRAKISSFPAGNDNECLTKEELLDTVTAVDGNYADIECPMIQDVKKFNTIWVYRVNGTIGTSYYVLEAFENVCSDVIVTVLLESGKQLTISIPAGESRRRMNMSTKSSIVSAQLSSVNSDDYYVYRLVIKN